MNGSLLSVLPVLALLFAGCRAIRPHEIPEDEEFIVAVKSVRIPDNEPWISRFAKHVFVDVKKGSEDRWRRMEIFNRHSGVVAEDLAPWEPRQDMRWRRNVEVIRIISGDEARRIATGLEVAALSYHADGFYRAWPGPNSNTFLKWLTRTVPGFHFEFDHNAAGKDYAPVFESGRTASGTGIQVDTPVLGIAVGLAEGIEIHVLQLTFGVSFLRPALKIPLLPRIGVQLR